MIKEYQCVIDVQIKHNRSKNFFCRNAENIFSFAPETIINADQACRMNRRDQEQLISYTVLKVLQEFCRINQYISFDEMDRGSLSNIYSSLLYNIKEGKDTYQTIAEQHYRNIRRWLLQSNPFVREIYSNLDIYLESVCCSEYSAELQLELLHMDVLTLSEPILDIGCGEQGTLVRYLRKTGLEAYGIERFSNNADFIQSTDWLAYDYGISRWGTIISNLGFSNHFQHNHLRKDGNYIIYAQKYMETLRSLKKGGCFHYAPALPFIEQFLNEKEYQVSNFKIDNLAHRTTIIKRL